MVKNSHDNPMGEGENEEFLIKNVFSIFTQWNFLPYSASCKSISKNMCRPNHKWNPSYMSCMDLPHSSLVFQN